MDSMWLTAFRRTGSPNESRRYAIAGAERTVEGADQPRNRKSRAECDREGRAGPRKFKGQNSGGLLIFEFNSMLRQNGEGSSLQPDGARPWLRHKFRKQGGRGGGYAGRPSTIESGPQWG